MTETIQFESAGPVARLILNNPARHNALGREQIDAVRTHLANLAEGDEARVLILTGAGDKTFCAGAALDELGAGKLGDDAFQLMAGDLADLPIPTLCALNGNVYGGGVELAASCDFRIGVEGSRMRVPAAALGLCYPLEGIERLVACLGAAATKRILVAAEELPAEAMLRLGFLDHLVPKVELERVADAMAARIAALAPLAVRAMKHILHQAALGSIDREAAADLARQCLGSEDLQEGLAAQRERRAPMFSGR